MRLGLNVVIFCAAALPFAGCASFHPSEEVERTLQRTLAAAEKSYPLDSPKVRAFVVAYEPGRESVRALARGYDVRLLNVDETW